MSYTDDFFDSLNKKKKKKQNTSDDTQVSNTSKSDDYTSEFVSALTEEDIAPFASATAEYNDKRKRTKATKKEDDDDIAPVRTKDDLINRRKELEESKASIWDVALNLLSGPFGTEKMQEEADKYMGGHNDYVDREISKIDKELAKLEGKPDTPKGGNKDSVFKEGAYSDGYQRGDALKTLGGTVGDAGIGVVKGAFGLVEGVKDLVQYGVAGTADLIGFDEYAERERASARASDADALFGKTQNWLDKYSVLGDKADAVTEGLGQVAGIILTGGAAGASGLGAAGTTAVTTGTMGLSSMGSGMGEAYNMGATDGEAFAYGAMTGTVDAVSELIFGGLGKGVKALGISKGLTSIDDVLAKKLSSTAARFITSEAGQKVVGNTIEYAVKSGAEGAEEVIAGLGTALAKDLVLLNEEDEKKYSEILKDENLLEQFVVGSIVSGIAQGGGMVKTTMRGEDFVSGHTATEEKVINAVVEKKIAEKEANGKKLTSKEKNKIYDDVVEEIGKGYVSIDSIEEILGGESYDAYKKATDENTALKKELDELNGIKASELTGKQSDRLAELKAMNLDDTTKANELRKKLSDDVFNLVKGDRKGKGSILLESYNERARKGQAFEADLTKYTGKQREAIERAIKSGVLNNTNRSHELVDILSKIEADKGIAFDYTDNAKLKESGFAIEGKTVNGFVKNGNVTLNVSSSKAWESTVGHEITHVLEGTKAYSELQSTLFKYAESKGELATRKAEITKLYENVENADIDGELTAELVSDYLFTDKNFINHLTGNRTVFQKVYDEIKYLYKVATGKEKASIEKVMKEFDRAWKELSVENSTEATDSEIDDVQYSVSVEDKKTLDSLNAQVAKGEYNAETNPDGGYYVTYKSMSYWGEDENGNAILRSPMAEYVDGELSNAYLIPKDKSKLNWYQATETIDENTGLPSGLLVKTKKEGNKSFTYLPASENQHLINEDWSNLYFNLQKKVLKNGKWVNSDVPARYNPYEHSSNSMLNDQFSAAYLRDNLVTVKMYVPISEDNGTFRAKYSKDATGWADWKTGTVAGKINKQKDLQRKVYLSRYAAPVEIVPDSEVAQAYKEYLDGTDVTIPDNVVSPNLLNELKKAGVPITESGKVKYSVSADSEGNELSLAVQKRFANSKAVDENGNLKVLYHGTAAGEFYTFDKSKGSVEGDFGSGFYFTDNESDVEANYEDGGPDFDNKVARRAEQIESEEEIDYSEAEARAREELYKGGFKHSVYLNIENPAIVGETYLFDYESFAEEYDREDYDSDEDYEGDVEQLIADKIDEIIWDIDRNVDIYSTDGISDVLWNAVNEGGIGIEQLKAQINELYLEDNNGNLVGNEVTRQIIESLGYDGIIDNTVSTKFNMGLDEGTTHYIVFKPNQIKSIDNQNPTDNPDIRKSLSNVGEQPSTFGTPLKDLALEQDIAPVAENATTEAPVANNATTTSEDMFPDGYAPATAEEVEALNKESFDALTDEDVPPEVEAPYYGDTEQIADNPFEERDIEAVGNRKVKAYMYENPEVKPFFQKEAEIMLNDLRGSTKGERWFDDKLYYDTNGEMGFNGTSRLTTEDIAYLLDNFGYTYDDIEKGLKAIIEDNGKENNACSKRIEFMLHDRLYYGYNSFGVDIPSNQEYIDFLFEKEITEYNEDEAKRFFENSDAYVPPVDEFDAPMLENIPVLPDSEMEQGTSAAIRPKPVKQPSLKRVDTTESKEKVAKVLTENPKTEKKKKKKKKSIVSTVIRNFVDKGAVFENLSLKTKNRVLQDKYKTMGRSETKAQYFMENGTKNVKPLDSIRKEVEQTGKTKEFYEYLYHKHNVDRMSLESKEQPNLSRLMGEMENLKLLHLQENQLRAIASEKITEETTDKRANVIKTVREYLKSKDVKNKPVFGYDVTAEMSQEAVKQFEEANPEFKEFAQDVYNYMNHLRKMLVDNGVISQETADLWAEMYPNYVPIRRADHDGLAINVPLDTNKTGINAPIKRATGGNSDILPLFETMAQRTMQTFKAIDKNRFGVELKNTLGGVAESTQTSLDEVIDSIDAHEDLLQAGKNGQNPTFTVFEGGERVTFDITDEMYDALKPTSEGLTYTNKVLNTASNLHRGVLTEYNPVFMVNNAIKDAQDVLINSQHPAKTYANYPVAIKELQTKGKWYTEYMENGGGDNTYFDKQTNTFGEEKSTLRKVVGFPLDKISDASNFVEKVPRLAEYIASRKNGASIDAAMLDAARVTTDFSAGGDVTKFLNRNGATFLNASVQGFAQQVRNVREAKANGLKGWLKLATKYAIAGLPAMLLNHILWDDDEEYEELSDYVKENYYVVAKHGDGKFVRIPKGRTLAVIQNAFEQTSNALTGDDEVDFSRFFELAMSNLAPNNPLDNNIIAPIKQVAENKTWYGEDLVPTRLQDVPAAEQYDESTDSISKWLGEKINYSPYKINYLLNQYSGGVGDVLLPMLTPEAESGDDSFVGNMIAPLKDKFTTDSVMNNKNVSDFYDTVDELTVNANGSDATEKDILKSKYMNSVNTELGKLYKEKREIQNSKLPDAEKYAKVRELQSKINTLSKNALNSYENVKIQGDYATVGDRHYRLDNGTWTKISDKQLERQKEVTRELGISPSEYWSKTEISYFPNSDGEYEYAYDNPENYAVSKVVGGYDTYKKYSKAIYNIEADRDANGKSIRDSRKEKVLDYINNLNADYETKLILFKSEYPADDTYNYEIIEYINNRQDLTYDERVSIYKKLGFTVEGGYVSWD